MEGNNKLNSNIVFHHLYTLRLHTGYFPTFVLFDSELSVRGSSQGLPSLINEVMEQVEKGSKVGDIYMTPPLYYVTNDAALEVSWKFPIPCTV